MLSRREVMVWLPTALAVARCAKPQSADARYLALSEAQVKALEAYADAVLPPDGSTLGAARYVDKLLSDTAPFIGSNGTPIELDRVSKAAWELRVKALREQLEPILSSGKTLAQLSLDDRELVCSLVTEAAFARPEYGGNPGLAGSKRVGSAGPVMPEGFVHWDGSKNVEQADAPVSTAEPGADPHPFDRRPATCSTR
ncbi:MAG: hypothetical protein IPJ65_31140 [Archangiaceae bacterium]|nr:hypothetical protein [Archangiaceae bacterium]